MIEMVEELRTLGAANGLTSVGIASAEPFTEARVEIERRKTLGLHGGMQFTFRNPARSTEPDRIVSGAQSIVVGARRYGDVIPDAPTDQPYGRAARYAHVDHYEDLRAGLNVLAERLRDDGYEATVVIDSNALVDRPAAVRAGLGWLGKNSLLLLPKEGSWFVIGNVVTNAPLPPDGESGGTCGTCNRCLDGCPTGSLIEPGVLDARRCLAWLVQDTADLPRQYRVAMGDRLYGCDICQEVCPPNRRDHDEAPAGDAVGPGPWVGLLDLLEADDEAVMVMAGQWYVPRRGARYVRRNALVALGNAIAAQGSGSSRADSVLVRYIRGADDMLASHAAWAARRMSRDDLCSVDIAGPLLAAEMAAPLPT